MNHRLNKLFLAALLTVLFLFSINPLLAQGDNPIIDSVPLEWIQTRNPSPPELDVITTSDGFDNFNLGTDFAEPHVTQNPNNPLQYFGAYNIKWCLVHKRRTRLDSDSTKLWYTSQW